MHQDNPVDWNAIAEGYDRIASQIYESPDLYRDALNLAPDCQGDILDVGCGQGLFLELVARTRPNVKSLSGCDLSPKLVEMSRERLPHADFQVANALELSQYSLESIDYLFMIGSLEHMIDHSRALRAAYRVLKPGGTICIAVPNKAWINYSKWLKNRTEFQPIDDYWFQPEEIISLIEEAGFKVEKIRGVWAMYRANWIHRIELAVAGVFPPLHQRMKLIGIRARK